MPAITWRPLAPTVSLAVPDRAGPMPTIFPPATAMSALIAPEGVTTVAPRTRRS